MRRLSWGVGVGVGLLALAAMTVGDPLPSDRVEQIRTAGAEVKAVRVLDVEGSREHSPSRGKDFYTARVVVELRGTRGDTAEATVGARSQDKLQRGDLISVMFAPSDLQLGALQWGSPELLAEVDGQTLSWFPRLVLAFLLLAAVGAALSTVRDQFGWRSFARLGDDGRSLRGQCAEAGRDRRAPDGEVVRPVRRAVLKVRAEAGTVYFLAPFPVRNVPESVSGENLWLCWAKLRRQSSKVTTPAVLVFDSGLVVHGKLAAPDVAKLETTSGMSAQWDARADQDRKLSLWDPQSLWPQSVSPFFLGLATLVIACAGLLAFDLDGGWRWAVGVVGVLAALAAAGEFAGDDPPDP
ncbi:hypothetical protein [Streptomyces luteolus]|uniref:DUF3592 domain-containing protein n=1 Tax=Streptomyces luteolus TaxID=3043615 RepID=A0ABT6T7A0_9ACTN|nr:hypothetical protein [Streptomyces sp. B-S-A12]MDI3423761.1 hypothetical protein [Streptomyces sp. B-S-A12]